VRQTLKAGGCDERPVDRPLVRRASY